MEPTDLIEQKQTEREQNQLDRRKVEQPTKDDLQAAIANVDDADARQALAVMYEVLTGEELDGTGDSA